MKFVYSKRSLHIILYLIMSSVSTKMKILLGFFLFSSLFFTTFVIITDTPNIWILISFFSGILTFLMTFELATTYILEEPEELKISTFPKYAVIRGLFALQIMTFATYYISQMIVDMNNNQLNGLGVIQFWVCGIIIVPFMTILTIEFFT